MSAQNFGSICCAVAVASTCVVLDASAQPGGVTAPQRGPPVLAVAPYTQAPADSCKRSKVDFMGQWATGVLGAWIGGVAAYALVDKLDPSDPRFRGDGSYKPNANTAFAIGSWVGSSSLIVRAGRRARRRGCGSFGGAAVGAAVPTLVLLLGRHEPLLPLLGALYIAPLQSLGGTLTFPIR